MRFRTVLLAEANSEYSHWLLSCLAEARVTVLASVSSPAAALAVGLEHAPDLALFGVDRPHGPMFTAGATLALRSTRTRVLFYTPRLNAALLREASLAGAAGVASRAWTPAMVARVVASLLRNGGDVSTVAASPAPSEFGPAGGLCGLLPVDAPL